MLYLDYLIAIFVLYVLYVFFNFCCTNGLRRILILEKEYGDGRRDFIAI